eukprot:4081350-Prymnesium_polylepis.3
MRRAPQTRRGGRLRRSHHPPASGGPSKFQSLGRPQSTWCRPRGVGHAVQAARRCKRLHLGEEPRVVVGLHARVPRRPLRDDRRRLIGRARDDGVGRSVRWTPCRSRNRRRSPWTRSTRPARRRIGRASAAAAHSGTRCSTTHRTSAPHLRHGNDHHKHLRQRRAAGLAAHAAALGGLLRAQLLTGCAARSAA